MRAFFYVVLELPPVMENKLLYKRRTLESYSYTSQDSSKPVIASPMIATLFPASFTTLPPATGPSAIEQHISMKNIKKIHITMLCVLTTRVSYPFS